MVEIKTSNIYNYLKSKFSNTSSDIKMNGTQSAGSSDRIARADHVHPIDTSRAAASHTHTKSNITDFPSTMTPSSHSHGDLTNAGAIGSTANKPIITGANGKLTAGSFGNSSNTFCEGNDSRLSNARTPTSHTHGSVTNDGKIGNASGKIITTGTSGVLQASDSITKSQISDFPSTMTPSSHTHGNISNDGKVGSASGKPLITTTEGAVTAGAFGTSSGEFAEGNHTHNYQEPIVSEYYSIHSKFKLYRFGKVVTLHVFDWTPAGQRDQYATLSLTIPEGYRPPRNIYLDDVVSNGMHIVIFPDGSMQQYVPSGTNGNFFGQTTWIVHDE